MALLPALHGMQQLFVHQRGQKERGRVHRFALKQRLQDEAGDGCAFRMFVAHSPDVLHRDPLIREEPAAGVLVHAEVDLVVRVGAHVVGQGVCALLNWEGFR